MPPKKPKPVQAKGTEAEDLIEEYLISQYKPFAINDIVQNLHNKVAKTVAIKALENLSTSGRVTTKFFGKVVIYACNEQKLSLPEEIDPSQYTMETLSQLRAELIEIEKDRENTLEAYKKVMNEPSNEQLKDVIGENRMTLQALKDSILQLQTNWVPTDEIVIHNLMDSELKLCKELKIRAKMMKTLIALIKDTVRPTNMAEFLVSISRATTITLKISLLLTN